MSLSLVGGLPRPLAYFYLRRWRWLGQDRAGHVPAVIAEPGWETESMTDEASWSNSQSSRSPLSRRRDPHTFGLIVWKFWDRCWCLHNTWAFQWHEKHYLTFPTSSYLMSSSPCRWCKPPLPWRGMGRRCPKQMVVWVSLGLATQQNDYLHQNLCCPLHKVRALAAFTSSFLSCSGHREL